VKAAVNALAPPCLVLAVCFEVTVDAGTSAQVMAAEAAAQVMAAEAAAQVMVAEHAAHLHTQSRQHI